MFRRLALCLILLASLALIPVAPPSVYADSIDEIKDQIEQINRQRRALDEEIAQYQRQLDVLGGEKQTLQGAIQTLDVSRQKTTAQIKEIQGKISGANLKLSQLSIEIGDKEQSIALDQAAVAESLRAIDAADDASVIEHLLGATDLSGLWVTMDSLGSLSSALQEHSSLLTQAKTFLASQHRDVASTKNELSSANVELADQKKALDVQKAEKASLLSQTQSKEAEYQALIAEKRRQQAQFESELSELEDMLNIDVDSSAIASVGSGVLRWPFSDSFMQGCAGKSGALGNISCITQYFGNTAFATQNAQIYNGAGHNGVDFGAPSGTPILAALSGTVMDTGNTDAVPGCYSFGKWVLVKHGNGLATLYAHLSSIGVSKGQSVATGDSLGNSGMTGYATGPHLHFAVYASQAVSVMSLAEYRGATSPCATAKMPVAPKDAYLNPMSYL
jgi:murein DD-endopeptidase MepM/ murein hydrolase activator NlpD